MYLGWLEAWLYYIKYDYFLQLVESQFIQIV